MCVHTGAFRSAGGLALEVAQLHAAAPHALVWARVHVARSLCQLVFSALGLRALRELAFSLCGFALLLGLVLQEQAQTI
jgi:hypothetical protein